MDHVYAAFSCIFKSGAKNCKMTTRCQRGQLVYHTLLLHCHHNLMVCVWERLQSEGLLFNGCTLLDLAHVFNVVITITLSFSGHVHGHTHRQKHTELKV